jgi:hypothetical protein
MKFSDPANLLQRIPQLERLLVNGHIRRAVASGDPFTLYRALLLARVLRRMPSEQALLRDLTSQRSLFARHPASGGGASERLPTSLSAWLCMAAATALLLVAALIGLAGPRAGHQDVLVLNGFEQPLTVTIGDRRKTVAPQGRLTLSVKTGRLQATAADSRGAPIDAIDEHLVGGTPLTVWNIAGATPLERQILVRGKDRPADADGGKDRIVYCGKRFFTLGEVRYLFRPAPGPIFLTAPSGERTVEQVDVPDFDGHRGANGASVCGFYLMSNGKREEATRILAATATLRGWDLGPAPTSAAIERAYSRKAQLELAQHAVKINPYYSLDQARTAQLLRDEDGQFDAMLAEHRAGALSLPDSAKEQYLYAALLEGKTGLKSMQELHTRFPDQPDILGNLATRKALHGDVDGAVRDFAALRTLSPQVAKSLMGVQARALIAAHRTAEALALLDAGAGDEKDFERVAHAREYALIARQSTGASANLEARMQAERLSEAGNTVHHDLERIIVGLAPLAEDAATHPIIRMALVLRDEPGNAMAAAAGMHMDEFGGLPLDQIALLHGEAARTGQAELDQALGWRLELPRSQLDLLRRYERGEAVTLADTDIGMDIRAAAMFIRSRNLTLPAGERAALRKAAGDADLLQGAVSNALRRWRD